MDEKCVHSCGVSHEHFGDLLIMMDKAFEMTPQVVPLLVRLYEGQQLYDLAQDRRPDARAELTGVVSELLEMRLSGREQEILSDVLITLARQAEIDLRQALSERIAAMDDVPLRLALFLANDEIGVAAPVLRYSPVLSDTDLIYIVKSKGAEYAQSIAARGDLSPLLIDALVDTRDVGTAVVLAGNERAVLTRYALNILGGMAKTDESLAQPLLARPELPHDLVRELYAHVGTQLQAHIRTAYGADVVARIRPAVDDIYVDFIDGATGFDYMPTRTMVDIAERHAESGSLSLQLVMGTIKRGQIPSFIALFARYAGLSPRRVHDMLLQSCPKGMAIACRAFGVQKGDFSSIYIMTHRMRSQNGRAFSQGEMLDILGYFDKVRPEVALRIVRSTGRA